MKLQAETTLNSGNNVNITSGNNTEMTSVVINNTLIDNQETLNSISNLNTTAGNSLSISEATEQHINEEVHDTWGGDIGRAALGGAITGLAVGAGMEFGKFAGEYLGGVVNTAVGGTTSISASTGATVFSSTLATSVSVGTTASTIAYTTTIGSAMSQATISGANFGDVLKAGEDSAKSSDTLKSVVIAGATAGITAGLTQYIDNTALVNGAIEAGNKATATLSQQLTTALYESAISTGTSTAVQSAINGDSFSDALKHQGLNIIAGTVANLGAKQIGSLAHSKLDVDANGNIIQLDPSINKLTQLGLHAGLGAITSGITGNDMLSGAISGVTGELTGEILKNYGVSKDTGKEIAGLTGGLSALITGKLTGLDSDEIANNIFQGQRTGKIIAENNSYADTINGMTGTMATPALIAACVANPLLCAGAGVVVVGGVAYYTYKDEINDWAGNVFKNETKNEGNGTQGSAEEQAVSNTGSGAVAGSPMMDPNDPNNYDKSEHAKERQQERGVSDQQIDDAIKNGDKYYDPKNNSYQYVNKNPDGTYTQVSVSPEGKIKTVINDTKLNKLLRSRYIQQ